MAKGIRVNQLAKELGVESKSILAKLRDEGLGEKAPNHMSLLPLGLAESVREWFTAGAGGTAVETAAPVEVVTKVKRTRKKAGTDAASDEGGSDDHLDAGGDHVATDVETPVEPEAAPETAEAPTPVVDAPAPSEPAPAEAVPAPVVADTPEVKPVVESPAVVETPVAPTPVVPPDVAPTPTPAPAPAVAAEAPTPTPAQPEVPHPPRHENRQVPRPTVTLADRPGGASVVERRPVVPQARLVTPEPARIQGPRVVREEKPEVVPAPRPRRPLPGQGTDTPAFSPTRPQGGRGVRVADDEEEKKKAGAKAGAKGTLSSRRRGPDGRRGEAMEKLKEYTEADLIERRERLSGAAGYRAGVNSHLKQRDRHFGPSKTIVQKGEPVTIEEPITVKTLSASLGIKANDIIRMLMRQGTMATINQTLSADAAATIAMEYNIELVIKEQATLEEVLKQEFLERPVEEDKLALRPPVVTILGHVDHGKTSLLDKIRSANVAAGESGGITQHTAAWMVQLGDRKVTFIDTPGHQAFTSMRARGANMTDVVVLVVSAAEGVQPQTIESINHAKAAGVPIVVAMNKIDRPDTNEQQVLGQLAQNELNPVEWGGDTEVIRTSAHTGQGIEDLLEILHYQAELLDLKADPTAPATGTVIESSISEGLGAVATVLVQNGTLKVGDIVLCGAGHGRVRSLVNDLGKQIPEAGPSTPVIISGLDVSPNSGDHFYVLDDMDRARAIAAERKQISRQETLSNKTQVTLENVFATMKEGQIKTINLIIKGDVQGSIETLAKTVTDFNTEEVRVRVIHSAVGGISESDVELADASGAVIIGFHVVPDDSARSMAEQRRVEVRLYSVIYEIFDDLKKAMSGMLEPEIREKMHGHAEVRNVIKISRIGNVAGCMVTDGHIQRGSKIRLIRNNIVITEDIAIESLRRVKDDVREVKSGLECGIKLSGYDDVKIGDVFEAYVRETIERTL